MLESLPGNVLDICKNVVYSMSLYGCLVSRRYTLMRMRQRDVTPWKIVRLWCHGSSDRSLMVDQLSYSSFQSAFHGWCNKDRAGANELVFLKKRFFYFYSVPFDLLQIMWS